MLRAAAWTGLALLAVVAAAASAAAQPAEPYIETVVRWQPGAETESTQRLNEDGRGGATTDVGFRVVGDVVCSDRAVYSLEVVLDNPDLPSWAGASLEPEDARLVEFALSEGRHSDTPYRYKPGPDLGIVWDLEEASEDATYTYHVVVDHARLVPESNECTPALSTRAQSHHAANLTALAPEAPSPDGDDGGAPPDGSSPGLTPVAILVVSLLAALRIHR